MTIFKKIIYKYTPYIVIFLALVGFAIATYLTYEYYSHAKTISNCPIFGDGCSLVLHSKYSSFMNTIPNALLGMLYYFFLIKLNILFLWKRNLLFLKTASFLSIIGTLFSGYLLYVQGALIGAFCFYCVSSATISMLILIIEIPVLLRHFKKTNPSLETPFSSHQS